MTPPPPPPPPPRERPLAKRRQPAIWLIVLVALAITVPTTLVLDVRLVKETIETSCFSGSVAWVPPSDTENNSPSAAASHDLFRDIAKEQKEQQQQQRNIRYIHLLGERNSGTNYIGQVLSSAFYPQYHRVVWDSKCRFVCGIPVFRFKHAFRHNLLSPTEMETLQQQPNNDILWILAVRSPCDWADAMYRNPWHLCTAKSQCSNNNPDQPAFINIAKLPAGTTRAKFWSTFPWLDHREAVLGNYTTDFSYRNVFALRKHKLLLMQQLMEAMPDRVHIVHLKTVERAPEALVERLRQQFGLFVNTTTYRSPRPSKKPHSKPLCLNAQEFVIAQKEIDWELESRFGFTPLGCHMCRKSRDHPTTS